MLTAARSGETVGATWAEIDLERRAMDRPGKPHQGWSTAPGAAVSGGTGDPQRHGRRTSQRLDFRWAGAGQADQRRRPRDAVATAWT